MQAKLWDIESKLEDDVQIDKDFENHLDENHLYASKLNTSL